MCPHYWWSSSKFRCRQRIANKTSQKRRQKTKPLSTEQHGSDWLESVCVCVYVLQCAGGGGGVGGDVLNRCENMGVVKYRELCVIYALRSRSPNSLRETDGQKTSVCIYVCLWGVWGSCGDQMSVLYLVTLWKGKPIGIPRQKIYRFYPPKTKKHVHTPHSFFFQLLFCCAVVLVPLFYYKDIFCLCFNVMKLLFSSVAVLIACLLYYFIPLFQTHCSLKFGTFEGQEQTWLS